MNALHLNKSMKKEWLKMLDEYWYEEDTPYSDSFGLWPAWLFRYYNEMPLGEAIKSSYLVRKSEQHILTPNV